MAVGLFLTKEIVGKVRCVVKMFKNYWIILMAKLNPQPVGSKIEPQKDTSKSLMIFSRIRDAELRRDLEIVGDGWSKGCVFFDEKQAQQEFSWLTSRNPIREYMLVALVAKKHDDLNDYVPF